MSLLELDYGVSRYPGETLELASELHSLAQERQKHLPAQLAPIFPLSRTALDEHRGKSAALLRKMIALQEELDWRCYRLN